MGIEIAAEKLSKTLLNSPNIKGDDDLMGFVTRFCSPGSEQNDRINAAVCLIAALRERHGPRHQLIPMVASYALNTFGLPAVREHELIRQETMLPPRSNTFIGKTAIVTGGGWLGGEAKKGFGVNSCLGLARQGISQLVIVDVNEAAAENTARLVREENPDTKVLIEVIDLGKTEQVESGFGKILNKVGQIDLLLNCAGIYKGIDFGKFDLAQWNLTLNINLIGPSFLSTLVGNHMRARWENGDQTGGKILFIGSDASEMGSMGDWGAYTASKAALTGVTASLANGYAKFGIDVVCLSPGPSDTVLLGAGITPQVLAGVTGQFRTPAEFGIIAAEEVASMATEILKPGSVHMTGTTVFMSPRILTI